MRTGFKVMGLATDISVEKRIYLIKGLVLRGVTYEGLRSMNATDMEIRIAVEELMEEEE